MNPPVSRPLADEPRETTPGSDRDERLGKVLTTRAIVLAGVVVVAVASGTLALLLALFGAGTPADQAQLDVFRATGNVVLGAGGAVALLLAARRQRLGELELRRKEHELAQRDRAQEHTEQVAAHNREHQLRLAEDARTDAAERRITELYMKAADQLGSEKTPIRLAGLYALERLAQNTSDQRQTIVNLLCAYLRLPYTLPTRPQLPPWSSLRPAGSTPDGSVQTGTGPSEQELEVRATAQRILADHLFPGDAPDAVRAEYWPGITLNLTGALLCHFDFRGCRVGNVRFGGARFAGWTRFEGVEFTGYAIFGGATFERSANFKGSRFRGRALFRGAAFRNGVTFEHAGFAGEALFGGMRTIDDAVHPDGAVFGGTATFAAATFGQGVVLDDAIVTDDAASHVWPSGWKSSADGQGRSLLFAAE
ncbi:pentapeptide repeat-containing protein [Amycolatopsis magusensis]|uniref:pentapeptide repeat-containing protein n=1 Tax=Amycolatopsis magusensis TaxID=882444 RepID=UPI0024A7C690|nr:pentapeptide repeat-containing protein [Amycolatopsis magusensis]MDI5981313.1 pentapeptide repeat-containing protein [Amycolatopsis magusensis]